MILLIVFFVQFKSCILFSFPFRRDKFLIRLHLEVWYISDTRKLLQYRVYLIVNTHWCRVSLRCGKHPGTLQYLVRRWELELIYGEHGVSFQEIRKNDNTCTRVCRLVFRLVKVCRLGILLLNSRLSL